MGKKNSTEHSSEDYRVQLLKFPVLGGIQIHVFIDRVHCHHKKVHPQATDTGDCTKITGTPITYLISTADSPQVWSSSLGVWVGYGMSTS
jgi:hypothetical protein